MSLSSVTANQTISIGGQTFTAVASDNWEQKANTFTAITGGSTIGFLGTTWTATTGTGVATAYTFHVDPADQGANISSFLTAVGVSLGSTSASGTVSGTLILLWGSSVNTNGITIASGGSVATSAVTTVTTGKFSIQGTDTQDAANLGICNYSCCYYSDGNFIWSYGHHCSRYWRRYTDRSQRYDGRNFND